MKKLMLALAAALLTGCTSTVPQTPRSPLQVNPSLDNTNPVNLILVNTVSGQPTAPWASA
ncbi:hypothetical protein MSS93_02385 [Deinococcus radiodurans]|nr:hypothetical protein MSS93_02385 [Deinococcus radiodurans]